MVLDALFGPQNPQKFTFDDDVRNEIYRIIKEAQSELILVSPYNKHPNQLQELIESAIRREVKVTLLYRDQDDQHDAAKALRERGATTLAVQWLHAKIYMHESAALTTSMNLLDSSFNNSWEFCFRVERDRDPALYEQLGEYVSKLRERARRTSPAAVPTKRTAPSPKSASASQAKSATPTATKGKASTSTTGHCIRCGKDVPWEQPLCKPDYRQWQRFEKWEYPEKFCHRCGHPRATSMERPVCPSCWKSLSGELRAALPKAPPKH